MKKLTIDLDERSYPILIDNLLFKGKAYHPFIKKEEVLLITNETIYHYHKSLILELVGGRGEAIYILPDGEAYKNADSLEKLLTKLLTLKFGRQAQLIAFGGGVIGDLVGFAASIYQRGINFVQVPTTLLAQVDSSVGGKTAINHPLGKNMIGSFYQPSSVLIDLSLLKTLPKREYISGLGEVIKNGFIFSHDFLEWLTNHREAILALDPSLVGEMVFKACDFKREIVNLDEKEQGVRALLNFGHTFGHAIEKNMQYKGILHGEAVAIGMVMAGKLSERLGLISEEDFTFLETMLDDFLLPIRMPRVIAIDEMIEAMKLDKKNINQTIRFILLEGLGQASVVGNIEEVLVREAIAYATPSAAL